MMCAVAERDPEVKLPVHASSQHVDLSRDGADVVLRAIASELDPGLIARILVRAPSSFVASPEYIARRGAPLTAGSGAHREAARGAPSPRQRGKKVRSAR